MAICITFGTQEFTSRLKGYENVTAQCHNCKFGALNDWKAFPSAPIPWGDGD
ncbi:hypothetical protein AJ78_02238 [Emergomyces pasteurianus Ep9510]|uniref:Uncharacterized protein n=1 Tax=Emergomyces pasteurianus Ep9510 TaxID=1447872 RepID=A0A1J9PMP8_9EURO|nr:hypothetical protein AJ78_02238 [Emergomyces pasteurianus Ep9510]